MLSKDPVAVAFGRNVRKRREEIDLTQEGLAEKAGLHRTYICNIERGHRNVTIASMVRLAKALGITASDLCDQLGCAEWEDSFGSDDQPQRKLCGTNIAAEAGVAIKRLKRA